MAGKWNSVAEDDGYANVEGERTKSDAECGTGLGKVILQSIVEHSKDGDEEVEEDPDGKKKALSTFVDHPEVPFLFECFRLVGNHGLGRRCVAPLESLKTPALCLVALEVCGLRGVGVVIQVGMCVERGLRAVGEVKTIARHGGVLAEGGCIRYKMYVDLRTNVKERDCE
jgi:hypothetical protein